MPGASALECVIFEHLLMKTIDMSIFQMPFPYREKDVGFSLKNHWERM